MPGTTLDARCARTASPIDDVTQKRSPKVAAAHSTMVSAGASSSSAPQWDTSSRSSSGERPSVSIPREARALRVVAAVMTDHYPKGARDPASSARTPSGSRGTPTIRGSRRAATGPARRSRGSAGGTRARSYECRLEGLLAAQQLLVGADHPGRERLAGCPVGQVVADHHGHVVVQPLARHLVGAELAAEVRLEPGRAAQV